ncbi:uncharacterized protein N7483_012892 [Penicillium malachiteum]|uniref:uncharacterized protein n=1 Tax=Penicillium malachiteum TaxID=1324776 RepID=UPI0025480371|nr:uncharacterized protein N7483_012892 [Penicillium malachiteum]KAJ5715711.1 hypothetical protein N7483_012892 [Penicillium malachiteum]
MATILAPYNTAMRLGTGFNSFTQQLCIDHAVVRDENAEKPLDITLLEKDIPQEVTYKTSIVDKVTDVTSAMNISAAFLIKYDNFDAKGKGDFLNTSKVKESDVSFMISVKVVNQVIQDHSLTKFSPISGLKGQNFAEVYGDSFISGFQYGGEFTAVISVKASDKVDSEDVKAKARILFTKDKLDLNINGKFDKESSSFLTENETTISVTYTGGGQHLKERDEDWTFETMKAAALKFPHLVAQTPMRTHAILTKYSSLRSYYAANVPTSLPSFEHAGVYTALLQEAYLDYKTIAKNLQVLAYDVSSGDQVLLAPRAANESQESTYKHSTASSPNSMVPVANPNPPSKDGYTMTPLIVKTPYPPTLQGIEDARSLVRLMLNRIVQEVDLISRMPELAAREDRELPYMSPFLFKEYLPIGEPKPSIVDATGPADSIPSLNQQISGGKIFA